MAQIYRTAPSLPRGELVIEELSSNCVEVFYIPPAHKLIKNGINPDDAELYKTSIMIINGQDNYIIMYPIDTWNITPHSQLSKGGIEPKYKKIGVITLEGFGFGIAETAENVEELCKAFPSGFVQDYDFGLGLLDDCRFIVKAVEEIEGITIIAINKKAKSEISIAGGICTINFKEYDSMRKGINTITRRGQAAARKIKSIATHNLLSSFLKIPEYPQKTPLANNDTLYKMIDQTSGESDELSKPDQEVIIKLISKNTKAIAEEQPEKLVKLRNDIELVSLEKLIENFEEMLKKNLREDKWQKLFNDNPFILGLAFGYPIIKIQEQAHVGGRKLSGSGEKITDFLVKNGISNNTALFEIKTPAATLLDNTAYRGNLYSPHKDLSGSINQMLDQKYKFQKEIATIKENTKNYGLETYSVHGVLIIGKMPLDDDRRKSFGLFRGNSKDITIITFDELLEKLKLLHKFLSST